MASNNENLIFVCTDCHSDQPSKYIETSLFDRPPCKYCGGVCVLIPQELREDILRNWKPGIS